MNKIRLPTNPGQTPTRVATFLMRLAKLMQVLITESAVFSPRTISNNFMTLAGEKKCSPITDSGRLVALAISFKSRADVFEASIASGLATSSNRVKISFFTAMFSNTASIIRSQSASSATSRAPLIRPQRFSTSSALKRPLRAVFS